MYFFCLGRHRRNGCDLPYLDVDQLEELVAQSLEDQTNCQRSWSIPVRHNLTADLDKQRTSATKLIDAARRKIEKIKRDRVVWATKSADGVIPDDIGRAKQNELTQQLVRAEHDLAKLEQATEDITAVIHAALDLIRDCGQAYAAAEPMLRRDWNQTFLHWDRRRRGPGGQVDAQSTLRHLDGPESHRPLRAANSDPRHPDTKKDPRRGPSQIS